MEYFAYYFYTLSSSLYYFAVLLLASFHQIDAQQNVNISNYHSKCGKKPLIAGMKTDVNLTINDVCSQLFATGLCVPHPYHTCDIVYVQVGLYLTLFDSSNLAVAGLCPYFPPGKCHVVTLHLWLDYYS